MAVRIEYAPNALEDIRYGRGPYGRVIDLEEAYAQQVCDRANSYGKGTFAVGSRPGNPGPPGFQGRHRVSVVTADAKAMASNAKHNILIRSMS